MTEATSSPDAQEAEHLPRLAYLLAMAMFVLVVDTSLMNVSISAVVEDLDTTVSGVQSAIALEALVSAAFILIGSKIGDLFGRKRAYVLGLLGYALGALSMALAQSLTAIVFFWAILGGLGASLLLPAMQSLIHGNFEGAAQRRVYALVGAAAAVAAAVGPLLGGFITTYMSYRVAFLLEVVVIAIVLSGIKLVHDVPYTGSRQVDVVGSILSVLAMGGTVLGILAWQEGGDAVAELLIIGAAAMATLVWWLVRRKREQKPTLLDPDLFKSLLFRYGVTGQMLQQIALGGAMIALPIYLQMVLEYNAMEAGLSLAPLSLSMFAVAIVAGKRAGDRRPAAIIQWGFALLTAGDGAADPDRAPGRIRVGAGDPADHRGLRPGPPGVTAQQLHAVPDQRGAGERGGRGELGGRVVRVVVRAGLRRRHHAGGPLADVHGHGRRQHRPHAGRAGSGRHRARRRRRGDDQHAPRRAARRRAPGDPGRDHPHQHRRATAGPPDRAPHPDPRRRPRPGQLDGA